MSQTFLFVEKLLFFEEAQISKFLVAVTDAKLLEPIHGKVDFCFEYTQNRQCPGLQDYVLET